MNSGMISQMQYFLDTEKNLGLIPEGATSGIPGGTPWGIPEAPRGRYSWKNFKKNSSGKPLEELLEESQKDFLAEKSQKEFLENMTVNSRKKSLRQSWKEFLEQSRKEPLEKSWIKTL